MTEITENKSALFYRLANCYSGFYCVIDGATAVTPPILSKISSSSAHHMAPDHVPGAFGIRWVSEASKGLRELQPDPRDTVPDEGAHAIPETCRW